MQIDPKREREELCLFRGDLKTTLLMSCSEPKPCIRYMLEEHLLELPQARPGLSDLLSKAQDLLGTDEFELFPPSTMPQNLCAIIGGVGARSFLHSDPMEWMGWNVLLEGRKLWTFLPPLPDLDASLETYRLAPNAFGSHNISAGWQSNVDLYQRGLKSAVDGSACASWPVEGAGHEVMQHAVSGVQEVGDLILIPPRHWHQVDPLCCLICRLYAAVRDMLQNIVSV